MLKPIPRSSNASMSKGAQAATAAIQTSESIQNRFDAT
jgi:hypothetical protein